MANLSTTTRCLDPNGIASEALHHEIDEGAHLRWKKLSAQVHGEDRQFIRLPTLENPDQLPCVQQFVDQKCGLNDHAEAIRGSLGLKAGDRMTFTLMTDGTVVMRVKSKRVMDLAGVLRRKGRKPVAITRLSR